MHVPRHPVHEQRALVPGPGQLHNNNFLEIFSHFLGNIFLQNNNNFHKNNYNKNLFLKDFLGQPGHIGTKKAWSLVVFMVQTMAANPTTSNLVNIMLMEPVDLVKREAEPQNAIMSVKIRHIPKNTKKI